MLKKMINILFYGYSRGMEFYEITMNELVEKQSRNASIIDVRSEQEYKEGHINGSLNIPGYKINKNILNILQDKNQEIVLYCKIGVRSKKAREKLVKYGYKNVYSLYGGLDNYI